MADERKSTVDLHGERALPSHLEAVSRISKRRQGDFNGLLFSPLPSGWIAIGERGVRNANANAAPPSFGSSQLHLESVWKLLFVHSRFFLVPSWNSDFQAFHLADARASKLISGGIKKFPQNSLLLFLAVFGILIMTSG